MTNQLTHLKQLANSPKEQSNYALEIIRTEKNVQVIKAALDVLVNNPLFEAKATLFALYSHYDSKRDMGGYIRSDILKALRPICSHDDIPLLERAVSTYEFTSTKREEASLLRANALIVLNELDSKLAGYYCVKLLTDKHTSTMSGEPALTAVRILASQENFLPLYYYALQLKPSSSETLSECLKNLHHLPLALMHKLIEIYQDIQDDVVLIGLFDLILAHESYLDFKKFIINFLSMTQKYDVYRYVVVTILTSRKKDLIKELLPIMEDETSPKKLDVLQQALPLLRDYPNVNLIISGIEKKVKHEMAGQRQSRLISPD